MYVINGPIGNKGGVETFNKYLYNDLKEKEEKVYKLYIFKKPQNYDSIHLFELLKQKEFVIISSLYYGLLHLLLKKHKKIQILHGFKPFIFKWSLKNIILDPIKSFISFITILISSKTADFVVSNSYLTKAFYKRMFNLHSHPIGIFFKSSLPNPPKKENLIYDFIFVGNLHPLKNPHLLLDIANELKKRGFEPKICFIGDGSEKKSLQQKAENLKIKADFLGHIPHEKIWEYLNKSKIFILPTDLETFGLGVAEALSSGTHSFATKYCGITDFVKTSHLHILNYQNDIEKIEKILQTSYDKTPLHNEYKNFVLNNLFIDKLKELIDDK